MLRLHFAIAAIVVAGTASSVFALPFHVSGSEAAEASISSGYFGRLPGSSVRLRVFDAPELAVIIQEDDPHKHIHDSGSDEHHPYSLTEVEVEDSFQMVSMPYAHHEDEISDSSLSMPISEYRERDVRLLFSRGHDEAVNSEEASGETAHKAAKRTHEDDQLPKLQTKLDACVKKLAEIQEQFKECQNILVECQRELSEYTAASKGKKKAEPESDDENPLKSILKMHPDWEFNCGGRGQTFNGSGVQFNSISGLTVHYNKAQVSHSGSDSLPNDEKKWKTYHTGDGKHLTYTGDLSVSTNSQGGKQFNTTGDMNFFN